MLRRASAASGAVFALLLAASYVLAGTMPVAGTAPERLVAFLNANSTTQEWSWFLASGPALLVGPWFLGALAAFLWRTNPAALHLTVAGFASAVVAGALLAAAGVFWGLFVYLGTQITSPSLVLVLAEARHFSEGAVCFPAAGAVLAFSLAARHSLRGWPALALLGAATAALQLANGVEDFALDGVTGAVGPAAFAALMAWIAAASVFLVASEAPEPAPRHRPVRQVEIEAAAAPAGGG